MSLYYEPDPANDDDPPLLPPILTPVVVPKTVDVFSKAIASEINGAISLPIKPSPNGLNC